MHNGALTTLYSLSCLLNHMFCFCVSTFSFVTLCFSMCVCFFDMCIRLLLLRLLWGAWFSFRQTRAHSLSTGRDVAEQQQNYNNTHNTHSFVNILAQWWCWTELHRSCWLVCLVNGTQFTVETYTHRHHTCTCTAEIGDKVSFATRSHLISNSLRHT